MIKSILRRMAYALGVLWIISLATFWLSKQMPGDEVLDYIHIDDTRFVSMVNPLDQRKSYDRVAHDRGLDLPEFYVSISPAAIHDGMKQILSPSERKNVNNWMRMSGRPEDAIQLYQELVSAMEHSCSSYGTGSKGFQVCNFYTRALATEDLDIISSNANLLAAEITSDSAVTDATRIEFFKVVNSIQQLQQDRAGGMNKTNWFPVLRWHGFQNQYHQWMTGLFLHKPLTSLIDGRNAWNKIYDALKWTLIMNGFALLLALIAGVAIGIWSGVHHGSRKERNLNWILFALFAIPSFWLATLLIYFFASGEFVKIFPAGGLGSYDTAGNPLEYAGILFLHFILPIVCLAAGALAYVSRQMKQSFLHEAKQPYALALKLHGVSEKTIRRHHIIPNALFPIITIIGGSVPALLSGSLIIEVIFSIPGIGRLMYSSLLARDWPVAFPLLMMAAIVTVISYILTDLIYKWADPRVKMVDG